MEDKLQGMLGVYNAKLIFWIKVSELKGILKIQPVNHLLFYFLAYLSLLPQIYAVFHDTRNDPNKCLPLFKDPLQTITWDNFYSKKMLPYSIDAAPMETLLKLQECLDACKGRIYRTRCVALFVDTLHAVKLP